MWKWSQSSSHLKIYNVHDCINRHIKLSKLWKITWCHASESAQRSKWKITIGPRSLINVEILISIIIFSVLKITFLSKVFILIVRKTILIAVIFFFTYILIDCTNVFFYTKYICVMIVFWNPWNSNMYFFVLFFLHSGWLLLLPFHEWDSSFLLVWICCYLTIIRFYRK